LREFAKFSNRTSTTHAFNSDQEYTHPEFQRKHPCVAIVMRAVMLLRCGATIAIHVFVVAALVERSKRCLL
jgi:hypothetical protein